MSAVVLDTMSRNNPGDVPGIVKGCIGLLDLPEFQGFIENSGGWVRKTNLTLPLPYRLSDASQSCIQFPCLAPSRKIYSTVRSGEMMDKICPFESGISKKAVPGCACKCLPATVWPEWGRLKSWLKFCHLLHPPTLPQLWKWQPPPASWIELNITNPLHKLRWAVDLCHNGIVF